MRVAKLDVRRRIFEGLLPSEQRELEFVSVPSFYTERGAFRTAGFEFEFSAIPLGDIVSIVQTLFGGEVDKISTFEYKVRGTRFGDFGIEIDSGILTKKKYQKPLETLGLGGELTSSDQIEQSLLDAFSSLVPFEISTPPIPLPDLSHLLSLEDSLRSHGALGTRAGLFYAFGLHINPELPKIDVHTIKRTVQSFLLLQPWIAKRVAVDLARRISPFISAYPSEYSQLVLQSGYRPSLSQFADDYLTHNANRNRALDLLPLLAFIDEKKVRAAVGEEHKVNPRPCFHYRLPNCDLDSPQWSFAKEWNTWAVVERLAAEEELIMTLLEQYENNTPSTLSQLVDPWPKTLEAILHFPQ